jgi:hypothetical protein
MTKRMFLLLRKLTLVFSFGVLSCLCTIYLFMSISKQQNELSEAYDYAVDAMNFPRLPEVATGNFWRSSLEPNSSIPELQDMDLVKLHNNNNNNNNNKTRYQYQNVPVVQNMLFIHVGKSGGTSLRSALKIQCDFMLYARPSKAVGQLCLSRLEPESRLSQVVTNFIHVQGFQGPRGVGYEGADSFLFVLRHPVDRAISWYNFVHPTNCKPQKMETPSCTIKKEIMANPNGRASKFFTCFPQIEHWVLELQQPYSKARKCSVFAWKVAGGKVPKRETFAVIMYYNVQSYASQSALLYPEKPVFVIRTEKLWEDAKDLDISLGGNGTFGQIEGSKKTHGSQKFTTPRESRLLVEDIKTLCCALIDEMDIYRVLLVLRAVNLGASSAQETWQGAIQRCGASSWTELKAACAARK